jgi:hypothetical protein
MEDFVPTPPDNFDPTLDPDATVRTYSGDTPFDENEWTEANLDSPIDLGEDEITKVEDIEKEGFRDVPPGVRVLEIIRMEFVKDPNPPTSNVWLKRADGTVRPANFNTRKILVHLSMPGDPKCSVRDDFFLPPLHPDELPAFKYGAKNGDEAEKKKDPKEHSFWFKKLVHFVARLGYDQDEKGHFKDPGAMLPRNWLYYPGTKIHRRVKVEILPGKAEPYPDKKNDPTGEKGLMVTPKRAFNKIRMFSYALEPPPRGVAEAQRAAATAARVQAGASPANFAAPAATNGGGGEPPFAPSSPAAEAADAGEEKSGRRGKRDRVNV